MLAVPGRIASALRRHFGEQGITPCWTRS